MPMPAHMTLTGTNTGEFTGPCDMAGREGTILIQAFNHEIYIPRDRQVGHSTGKRVHGAVSVVKVFDETSPLMYRSLSTGEVMTDVKIKWYRITPAGQEEHYFTHELINAIIVSMKPYMPNCLDPASESYTHMEEVQFTYQKIIWTFEDGGISAEDDWKAPSA